MAIQLLSWGSSAWDPVACTGTGLDWSHGVGQFRYKLVHGGAEEGKVARPAGGDLCAGLQRAGLGSTGGTSILPLSCLVRGCSSPSTGGQRAVLLGSREDLSLCILLVVLLNILVVLQVHA